MLVFISLGGIITGLIVKLFMTGKLYFIGVPSGAFGYAVLTGVISTLAMILVMTAFAQANAPIALITPMYNINTLWAMIFGALWFQEYKQISLVWAIAGAVLITFGAGCIGFAQKSTPG